MGTVISSLYTASLTMCLFRSGLYAIGTLRRERARSWLAWFLVVESASFACELLIAQPDAPLKGLWLGLRLGASLLSPVPLADRPRSGGVGAAPFCGARLRPPRGIGLVSYSRCP